MYQEFNDYMLKLGLPEQEYTNGIAVGVSGGADSTALALLMDAWCRERDIPLIALICDHGLREESGREAVTVFNRLQAKGIDAQILRLNIDKGSALQERARNARYEAMQDYMRQSIPAYGILAVAHHAMDQAETLAQRMSKDTSTPLGRAGMLPIRVMNEMLLIRPLLESGRWSLRDFLREENMPWIEDPSNQNTMFTRVRWRNYLNENPLKVEEYLKEAEKGLALFREVEEEKHTILRNSIITHEDFGASCVDMSCIPNNLAGTEAIREIIYRASGRIKKVNQESLSSCMTQSRTLNGAQVSHDGNVTWIFRELNLMPVPTKATSFSTWDGRIRLGQDEVNGFISELGSNDATRLRNKSKIKIPHRILSGIPCIRDHNKIVSIPQIGFGQPIDLIPMTRNLPDFINAEDIYKLSCK